MPKLTTLKQRVQAATSRLTTVTPGSWRSGDKDKSSTARGYGYRWQQARLEYLAANPYCVYCLRESGITAGSLEEIIEACEANGVRPVLADVVDHIKPHRGDQRLFWDRENWQPLCRRCHDTTKRAEESAADL